MLIIKLTEIIPISWWDRTGMLRFSSSIRSKGLQRQYLEQACLGSF